MTEEDFFIFLFAVSDVIAPQQHQGHMTGSRNVADDDDT